MSAPSAPAWPVVLTAADSGMAPPIPPPPPPPDSPTGLGDGNSDLDSDSDNESDGEYSHPLSSEDVLAQEAQKEALKREFLRLARSAAAVTPFDAASSDDTAALATLTLGQAHFKELLRSHIAHAAGADAAPDEAAMDAELSQLWLELPKAHDAQGAEGVTFPSLVAALAGGANPSAQPSRRGSASISQGEFEAGLAQANGHSGGGAAPVVPWATHRKSASGSQSLLSPPTPGAGGGKSDVLRSMFAPVRRASFKHPQHGHTLHAPPPTGASWRQKRHSDSARAGHAPSLLADALANGSNGVGAGERPRANTHFQALESPSPNSADMHPSVANSLPHSSDLLESIAVPSSAAMHSPFLSPPPPSRKAMANAGSSAGISEPASPISPATAADGGEVLPAALSSGPLPSGCLDLSHPDWMDLSWLVQAQPAAFSSSVPHSPLAGSPSNLGAQPFLDPSVAPASTLVSTAALQFAMQHYLSRYLNSHELSILASLLQFVRGGSSSGSGSDASKVAPSPDLLSYETLRKSIRCLHAAIRAQPESSVVDPLPSFAQALGLLPGGHFELAPALTTEELLEHLHAFTVLAPESSVALLQSFGPEILHDPPMQSLLSAYKSLQTRHARLEKEHGLLSTSREHLDSSHQDLSEQVPYLQMQLEESRREKAAMEREVAHAAEVEAHNRALQEANERVQKRLQQLTEDHAAMQSDLQIQRELSVAADEEHAFVSTTLARTKERVQALERELKEINATHTQQRLNDQHSITTLNESLRTHQHQYHDLLEKSRIFYRRLAAVGETSGLDPLDGDDDNVLVGSLARTIARSQRTLGSSVIQQDMDGSLGAELDDSQHHEAVGRVQQQSQEIESLKRQMATLTMNKDREIDRLHAEIEALQTAGKNATRTPLGTGPASDGEEQTQALCCSCSIM